MITQQTIDETLLLLIDMEYDLYNFGTALESYGFRVSDEPSLKPAIFKLLGLEGLAVSLFIGDTTDKDLEFADEIADLIYHDVLRPNEKLARIKELLPNE